MNTVWVSIRRLKTHEFRSTLRHIKKTGLTWHDIYIKLGQLENEAISRTLKQMTGLVIAYLLLVSLSDASTVSMTFQGITASIPTVFLTVTASVTLFFVHQGLQVVFMVMTLRNSEGLRLRLHGFSMGAYGFFNGQNDAALSTPVLLNGFVRERIPVSGFLAFLTVCVSATLLLPLLAMWAYLLSLQLEILQSTDILAFYRICAALGIFVLIASILTLLLFNVPLPMKKSSYMIRWGFLSTLYPVGNHPRVAIWIENQEQ